MIGSRARRLLPRFLALPALAGLMTLGCDTIHYQSDWGLTPTSEVPISGRQVPAGSFEGVPSSLLNEYAPREMIPRAESETWQIPEKSKRIPVALLIAAANDSYEDLDMFFTDDARWGFPDRRELDAHPIFDDDGGARFVDVFRAAASRYSAKATFTCPPQVSAASELIRSGAEPYWCWFMSNDHIDVMAFKLVTERGRARIDYIGMYPERPKGPVPVRSEVDDSSPPWGPVMKKTKPTMRPRLSPTPGVPGVGAGVGAPPPGATILGAPPTGGPPPGATILGAPPAGAPPAGAPPAGAPPAGAPPAGAPPAGAPPAGAPPAGAPPAGAPAPTPAPAG